MTGRRGPGQRLARARSFAMGCRGCTCGSRVTPSILHALVHSRRMQVATAVGAILSFAKIMRCISVKLNYLFEECTNTFGCLFIQLHLYSVSSSSILSKEGKREAYRQTDTETERERNRQTESFVAFIYWSFSQLLLRQTIYYTTVKAYSDCTLFVIRLLACF